LPKTISRLIRFMTGAAAVPEAIAQAEPEAAAQPEAEAAAQA